MQLGFVSAIFEDLSLEEVLAFAASEGYECVEAMCWPEGKRDRKYGGVRHIGVEDFTPSQADDLRALCVKHGVFISGLGYYSNPLAANDEEAEVAVAHLHKVIDAAAILKLDVNSFVGAHPGLNVEDNLKRYAEVWPDLVRHAEDRGVRIAIENCPMLFPRFWPFGMNLARTPEIWRRMYEIIPSASFGLNYDPSHLVMQLIDPIAPIREFGSRIFHTHAKDMRVDHERLQEVGSLVLPMERSTAKLPGLGDVNWGRWIAALNDIGYDGPVCVEVEDEAYTHTLEGRKRSLRISRNVLRPLIG